MEFFLPYLNVLRWLADNQLFSQLKSEALLFREESGDVRALPLLALASAQLGEWRQAIDTYKSVARRISGLDIESKIDLAGVDCTLMRIDNAVALLEPVLKQQPDNALALARLAWCRLQQNKLDEAQQLYSQSVELKAQRLPAWIGLTHLNLRLDKTEIAQKTLLDAIDIFKNLQADLPQPAIERFAAQFRCLQLEIWV